MPQSTRRKVKQVLVWLGLLHPSLGVKISREEKASIIVKHKIYARVFVETGTYKGWMVEKVGTHFRKVYSIELDPILCSQASERFRNRPNVILLCGDSGVEIAKVLKELKEPALFWLDAHGPGAIAADVSPVRKEVTAIVMHSITRHTILIDDARHLDRSTIALIKKLAIRNDYTFIIEDGLLKLYGK